MTDTSFVPGDTVRLKSGGPLMTVKSVDEIGIICVWFDNKNVKDDRFDQIMLEKSVEKPWERVR